MKCIRQWTYKVVRRMWVHTYYWINYYIFSCKTKFITLIDGSNYIDFINSWSSKPFGIKSMYWLKCTRIRSRSFQSNNQFFNSMILLYRFILACKNIDNPDSNVSDNLSIFKIVLNELIKRNCVINTLLIEKPVKNSPTKRFDELLIIFSKGVPEFLQFFTCLAFLSLLKLA